MHLMVVRSIGVGPSRSKEATMTTLDDLKEASGCTPSSKRLNLLSSLLGNCMCAPFPAGERSTGTQFVELHGVRMIGLGAVVDELTPKERVYDTLEQLTTRTERLISIGYVMEDKRLELESASGKNNVAISCKTTETMPLDAWSKSYPDKNRMSKQVQTIVEQIKVRDSV